MLVDQTMTIVTHFPEAKKFAGNSIFGTPLSEALLAEDSGTVTSVGPDGITRKYIFKALKQNSSKIGNAYVILGMPVTN